MAGSGLGECMAARVDALCAGVESGMTVREIVAVAWLSGAEDALRLVDTGAEAPVTVNRDLLAPSKSRLPFNAGFAAGADAVLDGVHGLVRSAGELRLAVEADGGRAMLRHPSRAGLEVA